MANEKLTITLTNARPVTISKEKWPIRASGSWKEWDNQYEFQANRVWSIWINVRQNNDGRTIIYGKYSYSTQFQGESGESYSAGIMLTPSEDEYPLSQRDADHDWVGARVVDAIREVGDTLISKMQDAGNEEYTHRVREVVSECIADLPAENID